MQIGEVLDRVRQTLLQNKPNAQCSTRNCRVDMAELPNNRIVADVDTVFEINGGTGKRCDRILCYENSSQGSLVVVLIELKGGTFDSATDIKAQLQGGANFVKKFIPPGVKTDCIPILFHGRGNHRTQFRKLGRLKINFGAEKLPISTGRCDTPKNLANVLKGVNVL